MKIRNRLLLWLAAGWLAAIPCVAQSDGKAQKAGRGNEARAVTADLASLKGQLESFQGALNRTVREELEHPFAVLQDAKGAYLPGFGAVFHMELNLHPLRLIWPFDTRPHTPEEVSKTRESKLARIRQLRHNLSELVREHGGGITALPAGENLAIAIHLYNFPSEADSKLPTQVVMEISHQALLDYQARRLTAEDYRRKELFLEF